MARIIAAQDASAAEESAGWSNRCENVASTLLPLCAALLLLFLLLPLHLLGDELLKAASTPVANTVVITQLIDTGPPIRLIAVDAFLRRAARTTHIRGITRKSLREGRCGGG